jgi:hypothetical protein
MLVGIALLRVLGIDAELGQVAVVIFDVFFVDNGVAIAIIIVFAVAACCCCSCHPRRMMRTRQAVAAVVAAWCGGLQQDGSSSRGDGACATCLRTILDHDAYQIACSGKCSRGQVYTTPLPLCGPGNTQVLTHHAHINSVLEMLIGQPSKQFVARCLVFLSICLVG